MSYNSNVTGSTGGARTAYHSGAHELNSGFSGVCVTQFQFSMYFFHQLLFLFLFFLVHLTKVHVCVCHHMAFVRRHFSHLNLLLWNYLTKLSQLWLWWFLSGILSKSKLCLTANLYRLGILWSKNLFKTFCKKIEVKLSFVGQLSKMVCSTPTFYNLQILNQVIHYMFRIAPFCFFNLFYS